MSSKPPAVEEPEDEEFGKRYSEENPPPIDMSDLSLPSAPPNY